MNGKRPTLWKVLSAALEPGMEIPHWSAEGRYKTERFKVVKVESHRIWIDISRATLPDTSFDRERYIKRDHFLRAAEVWNDYCQLAKLECRVRIQHAAPEPFEQRLVQK
jgi:hypothetical protein